MKLPRRRTAWLVAALLARASVAEAQESDTQKADRLFQEASQLAERGLFEQACPKLEQSLALDTAIGTEFNLAGCYEQIGRHADAWRHYRNVEKAAHAAGKREREAAARARLTAVESKLAWLRVEPGADVTVVALLLDETAVTLTPASPSGDGAARFELLPLDPGSHTLRARLAAGGEWSGTVRAQVGQTSTVVPVGARPEPKERPKPTETPPPRLGAQRSVALGVGGLAVTGLVVGGVAGVVSWINHDLGSERCDPAACTSRSGADAWNRASTAGDIATVGFVVGGVAAAAAVVLWVTAPKSTPARAGVRIDGQGLHF